MPAKKAATTMSRAARSTKNAEAPTVKATKATKSTKAATKEVEKPPTKAAAKANEPVKRSSKRKADDGPEQEQPQVNGTKRQRTKSVTPAPPSKKQVVAQPKVAVEKKSRKKTVINDAPTQRLDVYVFGEGSSGELGLGSAKGQTEVKRPRLNPLLKADKVGVVQLSVGGMHTAALTHDNKIVTWGVNDQGALGRDTTWDGGLRDIDDDDKSDSDSDSDSDTGINPRESEPAAVDVSALPEDTIFTQVICTDSATFALTDEGLVYGCGTFRSNEGIFGFSPKTLIQRELALVEGLKKIVMLAGGENHVLALQNNGAVFAWGSGQQNQLGRRILERTKLNSLIPTQFGLPKKMVNVGAGSYHSFAVHQNGDVYSWGLNSFGETGIAKDIGEGGEADVHHPTIIESLRGKGKVTVIEGGAHHSVAVTDQGELLVWGRLDGGQLGLNVSKLPEDNLVKDSNGNPRILTVPTRVPDIHAVYAAAGTDHCVAISKEGKAYAWGFSTTYQTGLGTDDDVELATWIDNTATRDKQLVWAGCGGQFSVIAGEAGEVNMVNGINGH